jgi:phage FluMu protein Com
MPINVTCPTCNATLRAPDTAAGKQIKCPKCQTVITVPGAAAPPESQVTPAAPPPPMATAAPAKAVVSDYEEENRPRRRERDDDYDDRPRRRWRRSSGKGDQQSSSNNGLSIGLGIGAIALGLLAAVFSLVPCCGAIVAWPAGGIGLILGLIGLAVCLMAKEKNVGAMIMTGLGSLINVGAIALATIWWVWYGAVAANTANNMNKMAQDAQQQIERAHKDNMLRQEDFERRQKEQQERDKKAKESQNPATPAEKMLSQNNLKKLYLAMVNYQDANNGWPNPKGGQPPIKGRLSWRVAVLPYIEQAELYKKFNLNEAWDSATNRKVLESNPMPKVFASPRAKPGEDYKTYYQTFTGPFTAFPFDNQQIALKDFKRPPENVWLLAEAARPVEWTRPDDIRVAPGSVPVGGIFEGDYNVICADGVAHYVRRSAFNDNEKLFMTNPQNPTPVAGWPPPQKEK